MSPSDPARFQAAVDGIVRAASVPKRPPVRQDGPSGRFYLIDNESYVSVTHALQVINKPALVNWAANQERVLVTDAAAELYLDLAKCPPMSRPAYVSTLQSRLGKAKAHQKELAKAGEIGIQVHQLIEWNLRNRLGQKVGPEPRVSDNATWALMAWEDWAQSVSLKPLLIEQAVFSTTHKYAGTMDLLAEVEGVVTLIDFKTSKGIYGEAHLQNVAYQTALSEMGHATPQAGKIVRLPKIQTDPGFEVVDTPPVGELFPVFLHVLALWKWWYAQEQTSKAAWQARKAGVPS